VSLLSSAKPDAACVLHELVERPLRWDGEETGLMLDRPFYLSRTSVKEAPLVIDVAKEMHESLERPVR
jgi:hypothetical protein